MQGVVSLRVSSWILDEMLANCIAESLATEARFECIVANMTNVPVWAILGCLEKKLFWWVGLGTAVE